jgi:hypothetical protein
VSAARVSSRARTREDRGGDPLDGLVNLFDLGIVLAVAFLLAALSSVKLSPSVLRDNQAKARQQQDSARDSVVQRRNERSGPIRLRPGDKVVGKGRRLGTVYRLEDGRTIIVRPR